MKGFAGFIQSNFFGGYSSVPLLKPHHSLRELFISGKIAKLHYWVSWNWSSAVGSSTAVQYFNIPNYVVRFLKGFLYVMRQVLWTFLMKRVVADASSTRILKTAGCGFMFSCMGDLHSRMLPFGLDNPPWRYLFTIYISGCFVAGVIGSCGIRCWCSVIAIRDSEASLNSSVAPGLTRLRPLNWADIQTASAALASSAWQRTRWHGMGFPARQRLFARQTETTERCNWQIFASRYSSWAV